METALAVLLTALAFVWIGDDEDEEKQDSSINIECNINADESPEDAGPALDARASTSYSQYKDER